MSSWAAELRRGALEGLRTAVVATAGWPVLSSAYRGAYALQTSRVADALRRIPGVRCVLLRGSRAGRLSPGLSDIDLVIVLEDAISSAEELVACESVFRRVRRVNLGAPLIRDIHVFRVAEIALLARAGSGLWGGLAYDSRPLWGRWELPTERPTSAVVHEALVRELWFWHARSVKHLFEGGKVGSGLAARAYAKAMIAQEVLESPDGNLASLWAGYATGTRRPVSHEGLIAMLRRIDEALPDAPEVVDSEPRSVHPILKSITNEIETWVQPLRRCPAVVGAVLSVEGARQSDSRLYLVLDADHVRAAEAIDQIGRHHRKTPFPRSDAFSRFAWPLVVTPRQLERTVLARWTASEPIARLRHGQVFWGSAGAPRATRAEMGRALALDGLGTLARLREIVATSATDRKASQLYEAIHGLLPVLEAFAAGRSIPTTYPPSTEEAFASPIEALEAKEQRRALLEHMGDMTRLLVPQVLATDSAAPGGAG
jgi:predicted nucleotidyltransferase